MVYSKKHQPVKALLLHICLLCSIGWITIPTVNAQGVITTVAGNGITQYIGVGSPATVFGLAFPKGIYVDKKGKVYIANSGYGIINTCYHDTLTNIIGDTSRAGDTGDGGLADTAGIDYPYGVWLDTAGNIYVTEWLNSLIRRVDAHTGIITTVCGTGGGGYSGDGGPATAAQIYHPNAICTDVAGNIYIPDYNNQRIRKVTVSTGEITTIAGSGYNGFDGDGGMATDAKLSFPNSVSVDAAGNVYFTEMGNSTVRRVDVSTGIIKTIAGTGTPGYSANGTLAIHAQLREPNSVFVDKYGYTYISDFGNDIIRVITPDSLLYTIAGNGMYNYTGDGGPPLEASFRGPSAVFVDDSGYIYIADGVASVVRKMSPIVELNVGVKEITLPVFDIYPNPSNGKFVLTPGRQSADADMTICNTIGQVVYSGPVSGRAVNIDLRNAPSGMYFVKYSTSSGETTKKIILR